MRPAGFLARVRCDRGSLQTVASLQIDSYSHPFMLNVELNVCYKILASYTLSTPKSHPSSPFHNYAIANQISVKRG